MKKRLCLKFEAALKCLHNKDAPPLRGDLDNPYVIEFYKLEKVYDI